MALTTLFGFRPKPVTFLLTVTYLSLLTALLAIHIQTPLSETHYAGTNLTTAWNDLRAITAEYHPYNSPANDRVREYLLSRLEPLVNSTPHALLVDDNTSNIHFAGSGNVSVYFEGTNVAVNVAGTNPNLSPVLVNAHYDSVSTGYGATDDGVGVVVALQVVESVLVRERTPRGVIVLFNNGEEDYLNGARAWTVNPLSQEPHTFINLEGAGAGGRAVLFRSTDVEVTRWYKNVKNPFGTVAGDDGFKQGLVRSETDYRVFVGDLGMRGLDVAFWDPRSRYHTEDDDVRHTGVGSVGHMLGLALGALEAATKDTSGQFDEDGKAGKGKGGVWFDWFGKAFAVFELHTLFALTITLLVVPVVVMALTAYTLYYQNKLYYLSNTPLHPPPPASASDDTPTTTRGLRGLFRFPIAFLIAAGTAVGLAFLVDKINPMIAYSSQYSVWVMFLSIFFSLLWFVLRGASEIRPTALQRGYALVELWGLWWVLMVVVAVTIDRAELGSGYFIMFSYIGIFLAAWISLLECFALPPKTPRDNTGSSSSSETASLNADVEEPGSAEDEAVSERTPLFRGDTERTTFTTGYQHDTSTASSSDPIPGVYGKEQAWSAALLDWLWLPQFLFAVPVPIMFVTPLTLFVTTAIAKSGADGVDMLSFYLFSAALSILLLLPTAPFLHRLTHHIPATVFLIFIITLIYNLTAFPFSDTQRLKVYFQQSVNLEADHTTSILVGHPGFVKGIVADHLPSASGLLLNTTSDKARLGLTRVEWSGIPPPIDAGFLNSTVEPLGEGSALFRVSARESRNCKILFNQPVSSINFRNRKHPVSTVLGDPIPVGGVKELRLWSREWEDSWEVEVSWNKASSATLSDSDTPTAEKDGKGEVETELVKRAGDRVRETTARRGRVVCMWADANGMEEKVPGLWEVMRYAPRWSVVSKLADGLVEGWRGWEM